ncbi:SPOR domain-containing protein [Ferrimonas gelatinilytica]|uniref:Cell division protein DedD n=1 Tax=Ferrimonas gelatinilytica TaxID=1255257 RepID=A0ABP9S3I0_9GAMM
MQNRLVGLMVLTALGALFLPDLLNGEKARVEEQFATIPLRPNTAAISTPEDAFAPIEAQAAPVLPELEEEVEPATQASQDRPDNDSVEPQPKPRPSTERPKAQSQAETAGWTLRVGSFRSAQNVKRLVQELREKGYPAYSVPSAPVEGELTVVYIGPEIDRKVLAAMQDKLERQRSLKGRLERYDPLKI